MANKKITELTAIDVVSAGDLFPVVDDPGGTPVTKKATQTQVLAPAERTANKGAANGYPALDANSDMALANLFPASAATRLLGRGSSGGAGDWQEVTVGSGLAMTGTVLSATAVGGGAAWTLVEERTADAATEDFINLSAYNEILIVLGAVTSGDAAILQCLVSTDNGSSFLNTSGDYLSIDASAVPANDTTMSMHNTAATAARTTWRIISLFNTTKRKISWSGTGVGANFSYAIPTTSALNAIRVRTHTGSVMGGTILVYGRT